MTTQTPDDNSLSNVSGELKVPWQALKFAGGCPNCGAEGNQEFVDKLFLDVAYEYYHKGFAKAALALSSADSSGSDNVPLPKGSGEQPTSVETDYAILPLCNCDGFWHTYSTEEKPSKYLDDLVAEERRQAKIAEVSWTLAKLLGTNLKLETNPNAIKDLREYLDNRLTELRGENNE